MRCRRLSWSQGTCLWLPGLWTGSFSGGTQQLYGAFVPRAPVAMVTQKPLRRVLCTRPASTPSGVGTCHHGNRFPHLTKGPPNRLWAGAEGWALSAGAGPTLARLAVKSTHSKSCPILCRNSSTCGRFSTYTCNGRDTRQVSHSSRQGKPGALRALGRKDP